MEIVTPLFLFILSYKLSCLKIGNGANLSNAVVIGSSSRIEINRLCGFAAHRLGISSQDMVNGSKHGKRI
jgi:hypothetical protein